MQDLGFGMQGVWPQPPLNVEVFRPSSFVFRVEWLIGLGTWVVGFSFMLRA